MHTREGESLISKEGVRCTMHEGAVAHVCWSHEHCVRKLGRESILFLMKVLFTHYAKGMQRLFSGCISLMFVNVIVWGQFIFDLFTFSLSHVFHFSFTLSPDISTVSFLLLAFCFMFFFFFFSFLFSFLYCFLFSLSLSIFLSLLISLSRSYSDTIDILFLTMPVSWNCNLRKLVRM